MPEKISKQEVKQETLAPSPVQQLVQELSAEPPEATGKAEPEPVPETKPPAKPEEAKTKNETKAQKPPLSDYDGVPVQLADLMKKNGVKVEEIQRVVAIKGYYPNNTPIEKYDPGFIDGVLVGAWDQVFAVIVDNRNLPY